MNEQQQFAEKQFRAAITHIDGPITPERIVSLTKHLKINGRPFESTLHRLAGIGRGVSWDRPDEQEKAA